ncbi:MAG: hypothetical protein SNG02_05575 [Rikenellaceae bacterium]
MKYNILSIIEPQEVRLIAFSDVASVPTEMISGPNIEYAISRFVAPVTGHELLAAMSRGEYDELRVKFVQSAIAFYVRYISAYDGEDTALKVLTRARHYLKQLSHHLEVNSSSYGEYNGAENILNRCKIYGDLVQIL